MVKNIPPLVSERQLDQSLTLRLTLFRVYQKCLCLLSFKGFFARTHHELLSSAIFGHSRSSSSSSRRKPYYEYSENATKLLMIMIIMRLEKTYAPASLITSLSSSLDQINKMIHNSFLSTVVIKYTIEPQIMI